MLENSCRPILDVLLQNDELKDTHVPTRPFLSVMKLVGYHITGGRGVCVCVCMRMCVCVTIPHPQFPMFAFDRFSVPEFPHSSATSNIISGSRTLASPEVPQGALGDRACPMQCSQPCPMPANRHLTGLTWFPITLYYIK